MSLQQQKQLGSGSSQRIYPTSQHSQQADMNNYTMSQQERIILSERNANNISSSIVNQLAQDMILLATCGAATSSSVNCKANSGVVPCASNSNNVSRVTSGTHINTVNKSILSSQNHQQSTAVQPVSSTVTHHSYASNFNLNANRSASGSTNINMQLSEIESAILRSSMPLDLNETEEITVNGERGILLNKNEIASWRGGIPLSQYSINDDPNPEIIRKTTDQKLTYHQEVAIRYLRPPTPPPPGEILIQQEMNTFVPPAPPLVIRQQPPRPTTPPPLVVREAPPPPPPAIGRKVITISGKSIPPPPRKVIIERLPPLPTKPQSVIIERWLPYKQIKRRVIYSKSNNSDAVVVKPKNVIIQWEPPKVQVKKEFKDLGIVRANPIEYVERYGSSLKRAMELPTFVKDIKPPAGLQLASENSAGHHEAVYELEGDVYALNLIDLEREGLIEYKHLLKQIENVKNTKTTSFNEVRASPLNNNNTASQSQIKVKSPVNSTSFIQQQQQQQQQQQLMSSSVQHSNYHQTMSESSSESDENNTNNNTRVSEIFSLIDIDSNNTISLNEAEKLFEKLNSRLGKSSGEHDLKEFFSYIEINDDGRVDFGEFRRVFEQRL